MFGIFRADTPMDMTRGIKKLSNITGNVRVFGAGFVGFANGLVYAEKYKVEFVDFNQTRVDLLNTGNAPIEDDDASTVPDAVWNNISATNTFPSLWQNCDLVVVAVPTDYDEASRKFDLTILERTLHKIRSNSESVPIIIKSTLPVGFTSAFSAKNKYSNIFFSPEFLQEGSAIKNAKSPSRVILSPSNDLAQDLLADLEKLTNVEPSLCTLMPTTEAEAVKLFANGFLALRVAFFNELDSFCLAKDLNSEDIVKGICLDPRIGMHYNNPSFGFGGYCFPKDTKQLREQVSDCGSALIKNISESNDLRISYVVKHIIETYGKNVGVYKLAMKSGTKNARSSAMVRVIDALVSNGCSVSVFDPDNAEFVFERGDVRFVHSPEELNRNSDVILANRTINDAQLAKLTPPIFTRDIFNRD